MKKLFTSLIAIILGFLIGAIVLKITGVSPIEAYSEMWNGAFSKPHFISTIIIRSTPLILTGLSVAFAFRTGLFNIGAEGQFIIGSLAATFFGLKFNFDPIIQIPLVLLLAIFFSGLYGALSGYLKAKFGVHEVISTIMLNWIALYFSNWSVMQTSIHRPHTETTEFINPSGSITFLENWKLSEEGIQYLSSHPFIQQFLRPPVNFGIVIAIVSAFIIWIILKRTVFGYELTAVGFNQNASLYGGIPVKKRMTQSMFISGALAGLAGATHVLGFSKNIAILAGPEGYGFDGIAVSLIGVNHPIGVIVSGFFIGTLKYSGQKLQSLLEIPSEVITLMIGVIVLFIALEPLILKSINRIMKFIRRNASGEIHD